MKIALIAPRAESIINFRGELIKAFVRAGHEVTVLMPGNDEKTIRQLRAIGANHRTIALDRTGLNLINDIKTMNSLIRVLRGLRPDITFGYTIKPVIYGSIASRLARVPKRFSMLPGIGYVFGNESRKQRFLEQVVGRLYRWSLALNEAVFFQNPDDLELFVKRGLVRKSPVLINGSGVDVDHFGLVPLPESPPIVFLMIGRLLRTKGVFEYVDAARVIKSKYPEAVFRLLGRFDPNPEVIDESTLYSWTDEGLIEYYGEVEDVRPFIADAHVYVLPSYREGTSRTVLEAMSMGRAIITTDAPGCWQTVENGENGYRVPVRDSKALAVAMERFVKEPRLMRKMGKKSRQIAVEKYDVHKVNRTIMEHMGL